MKTRTLSLLLSTVAMLTTYSAAQAADTVVSRDGGQVVYDATTNLSWISNMNLAATNSFGVSGIGSYGLGAGTMSWSQAESWIAGLNAADYLGYNDWRLPTTLAPDSSCGGTASNGLGSSYGCTGSEMGNLYYNVLGGISGHTLSSTHNANYALFSNYPTNFYWSGTEDVRYPGAAWAFNLTTGGAQLSRYEYSTAGQALAVRTGDVAAAPVPEPESYLLMLFGLSVIGFVARKKATRTT